MCNTDPVQKNSATTYGGKSTIFNFDNERFVNYSSQQFVPT